MSTQENYDSARADRQLDAIAETVRMAGRLGIELWLRGGWAMDFFLGEVSRDHVDIDWFAWATDADKLQTEMCRRGYSALSGPPADQQLDFVRGDVELSFALLARDECDRVVVAGGPWAGEPWPDGMLEAPPGRIGTLSCPIVSPDAQIEIKEMMPIWVTGMPRRSKDVSDVVRLRAALGEPDVRPG